MTHTQQTLEDFLNSPVRELRKGIYTWHEKYYQVVVYKTLLKKGGWSQYIKYRYKGKLYGIRELTEPMLEKLVG
jgi:hypothetical protein